MVQATKGGSHGGASSSQGSMCGSYANRQDTQGGSYRGASSIDQDTLGGSYSTDSSSLSGSVFVDTACSKRRSDHEHRSGVKQKKMKMEANTKDRILELEMSFLKSEAEKLKAEKEKLEEENKILGRCLVSHKQTIEELRSSIKKMKSDLHKSELKCIDQNASIQILNQEIKQRDLLLENQKLKYELALLQNKANLDVKC